CCRDVRSARAERGGASRQRSRRRGDPEPRGTGGHTDPGQHPRSERGGDTGTAAHAEPGRSRHADTDAATERRPDTAAASETNAKAHAKANPDASGSDADPSGSNPDPSGSDPDAAGSHADARHVAGPLTADRLVAVDGNPLLYSRGLVRLPMIEPGRTGAYLALFSEIGFILLVTTLGGALGGRWIDLQIGVSPLFLLVGLLGGLAAGALVVYRLISRFLASSED